jgi:hypothetical protein
MINQGQTLNNLGGIMGDLVVYHSLIPATISSTHPTVNNATVAGEFPGSLVCKNGIPSRGRTRASQEVSL